MAQVEKEPAPMWLVASWMGVRAETRVLQFSTIEAIMVRGLEFRLEQLSFSGSGRCIHDRIEKIGKMFPCCKRKLGLEDHYVTARIVVGQGSRGGIHHLKIWYWDFCSI